MMGDTGEFPDGHFDHKDRLDEGVSFAHVATHFRDGDLFQRGWLEVMATVPGSGRLRVMDDSSTGAGLANLERTVGVLAIYEPLMPAELRKRIVVSMRDLEYRGEGDDEAVKVDLVSHYGVRERVTGMDLGRLVACLGIMFGAAPSPDDVFRGEVEGTGLIQSGHTAVAPPEVADVYAMRRDGIRRMFIGRPVDESKYPLARLRKAATTNLGPGILPLIIIIVGHVRELWDCLLEGPDCILPRRLVRTDLAVTRREAIVGDDRSRGVGLEQPMIGTEDTSDFVVEEEQHQEEEDMVVDHVDDHSGALEPNPGTEDQPVAEDNNAGGSVEGQQHQRREEERKEAVDVVDTRRWIPGMQVVEKVGSLFRSGVQSFWRRG